MSQRLMPCQTEHRTQPIGVSVPSRGVHPPAALPAMSELFAKTAYSFLFRAGRFTPRRPCRRCPSYLLKRHKPLAHTGAASIACARDVNALFPVAGPTARIDVFFLEKIRSALILHPFQPGAA